MRADRSRVYAASSTARTSGKDFAAWAHAPRKIHTDPATRIRFPLVDSTEDASTACFAHANSTKRVSLAFGWLGALNFRAVARAARARCGAQLAAPVAQDQPQERNSAPDAALRPEGLLSAARQRRRAVAQRLLRRRTHRNNLSGKPGDFGRATSEQPRRRLLFVFFESFVIKPWSSCPPP